MDKITTMNLNLCFGVIIVLMGIMTVVMAEESTEISEEKEVICGNEIPDNQTTYYRNILWNTYGNIWKKWTTRLRDYLTNANTFEPGDVVYCWMRDSGLARHYALCTAKYRLVHVQYHTIILSDSRSWDDIGCDGPFRIDDEYIIDASMATVLAENMAGTIVCYDVNTCNAQHFVMFWIDNDVCINQSKHCPNKKCLADYKKEKDDVYKVNQFENSNFQME